MDVECGTLCENGYVVWHVWDEATQKKDDRVEMNQDTIQHMMNI